MTGTIEARALALWCRVRDERGFSDPATSPSRETTAWLEALCRAIEAHDADKQKVSDSLKEFLVAYERVYKPSDIMREHLAQFIIPEPVDLLLEAMCEVFPGYDKLRPAGAAREEALKIATALASRGYTIIKNTEASDAPGE